MDGPWTASLRLRYMGPRALDTLNSARSKPTTLLDFGSRYTVNKSFTLGLGVFNLAGKKGNDIEYLYSSCTAGEVVGGTCGGGVEDRHIHPTEPRSFRLSGRWSF